MHPEVRHDAIEDWVDHHNFCKNIGLGVALDRRLKIALAEHEVQIQEFQDIDSILKKELRVEWRWKINKWRADWKITEAQVKLDLQKDELEELSKGGKTVQRMSMMGFLMMGLELGNNQ
ncbi:hypothetical protein ARMGADRAFT_1082143 [Armillaria gallica]|uniref:Uncharacterized protein n=1 Tax=Armillaria gallica TaxID=47427 RepID=A0A2H3D6L9_ARMGA|nr:hypothetical protein ARMGADRAFT_1082143 [Armillaria gallica]